MFFLVDDTLFIDGAKGSRGRKNELETTKIIYCT